MTGCTPFELVLSRPPKAVALQNIPAMDDGLTAKEARGLFLRNIRVLMAGATARLEAAQAR